MAIAVRCVVRAPPKTSLVVRRAGAAQDESGGGRISVTEGIMAHAMTYYAAISACSMGGICIPAMRSHTFIFKSLISVVKRAGSKSWHDISSWNEMPLCSSGRPHAFVLLSARARRTRRWT